jgi:glucan phosphorylase
MCILFAVYKYLQIKTLEDKNEVVPRFIFIGGKTAPGNLKSKHILKLIH